MTDPARERQQLQRGYTLTEALIAVWLVFALAAVVSLVVIAVVAAAHFVGKFW